MNNKNSNHLRLEIGSKILDQIKEELRFTSIEIEYHKFLEKCKDNKILNQSFINQNLFLLSNENIQTIKNIIEQLLTDDKILIYTFQ